METALILAATGVDSTVVAAGLLHDAIDDSNLSLALLRGALGEDVASLVIGVCIPFCLITLRTINSSVM
jgi:(p)ppGpp synthase/HD superfamily hydrolase